MIFKYFLVLFLLGFTIFEGIYIFNRSYNLGTVFFTAILYCIFTIVAYLFYPLKLCIVSYGQYYPMKYFYEYYIYIFLSFQMIFILFILFNKIKFKYFFSVENKKVTKTLLLRKVVIVLYFLMAIYLTLMLLENIGTLSYFDQDIMKLNKIWFFIYEISFLLLIPLIDYIKKIKEKSKKILIFLLIIWIIIIDVIIAIKVGQRIQLFSFIISCSIFYLSKKQSKITFGFFKKNKKIVLLIFIFIISSQFIRFTRGGIGKAISFDKEMIVGLFDFEVIVFQDYTLPSLTLITSMFNNSIIPNVIIKSNIYNNIIGLDATTPGAYLSRLIDPNGITGYGYYIFTEGYNLCGWIGIFIIPLCLVITYYLYYNLLCKSTDKDFNSCIFATIAFYTISIVRGGTLFLIKGIYFYIIPVIIVYILLNNKKLRFNRIIKKT